MEKKLKKLKLGNFTSSALDFSSQKNIRGGQITTGHGVSHTSSVGEVTNTGEVPTEFITMTEYEW